MKLTIINAHADNPNIEMLASVGDGHECDIIYSDLSASEKTTYDDAMGVIVQDSFCTIENTPYELDIQRMTSSVINENVPSSEPQATDEITKSTIDYLTLSASDQAKLDVFNQLLIDKCW